MYMSMRKTSYMADGSVYVATFINILLIRMGVSEESCLWTEWVE